MDFEADGYEYWRNALDGVFGPVHDDGRAGSGFWRLRAPESANKRGAAKFVGAKAVAIWRIEGTGTICTVDGVPADPADIWLLVCKWPVTEEDYRAHRETGVWPDVARESK